MSSKGITALIQGAVWGICLLLCSFPVMAEQLCEKPAGRLISVQGGALVQRVGQSTWQEVAGEAYFCPGDRLMVNRSGRAAVVLANETILRLDQMSTISFPESPSDTFSVVEFFQGIFHIFSNRPRSLKVITPYVNGVVEGTEFLVEVETDAATITVFQGRVEAVNAQGQLSLGDGQSALARQGMAPAYRAVVRPRDAVAWTLYYPAVIETAADGDDDIAASLRRAGTALEVGRLDEARSLLLQIREQAPENVESLALLSVIETVRNNSQSAFELARQAIAADPDSAAAGLALSYAYQAQFDIAAALAALEKASETNPANGLVKARLAELLVAVGELDRAEKAAAEAVSLSPAAGLSHTVLGFVHLSRVEIEEAQEAFRAAISRDPAQPLARLGLGLSKIRQGKLAEGRADIEIAAALGPGDALIRSYLGKAYFAEKRDGSAGRQYQIAKELDPADPTPWFYDAIRKQTTNRPVEALRDLQQSMDRNDNRAVYRSRLLLDDDLAARSAALARVYTDLGFEQLARSIGIRSVQIDPGNYSAHRFLADVYRAQPRHEIARVSELLQSQLLQPINITPVQPQLAESDSLLVDGAGPASTGFNEFNSLFLRDDITFQASGMFGSNDLLADEVVLSGVRGNFSYSVGQLHFESDGIRENSDKEHDIYSAFLQARLSPATSIMTELRYRERTYGDTALRIDLEDFSSSLRQSDESRSFRIGLRHDLNPSSILLGTAVLGTDEGRSTTRPDGFFYTDSAYKLETDHQMIEAQHIYQGSKFNLRSGAGYLNGEAKETYVENFPMVFFDENDFTTDHFNLYSYSQIHLLDEVAITLGLGFDGVDSLMKDDSEFNPKLGIVWQPSMATQIRAAAFRSTTRFLFYGQTIEPTSVAGFNQFYDDMEGTTAWTYGTAIDHSFSSEWYGGAQYFRRLLDVPYPDFSPTFEILLEEDEWQEDIGSAYLYWTLSSRMALGLEYYYERYEHERFEGMQEIRRLTNHRIVPTVKFFHPCGVSTTLRAGYVNQKGDFGSRFLGYEEKDDEFWVFDLSLSYRLPKRYGILQLQVNNLFDEDFAYLDTDPAQSRLLQERQILASFTVSF
ncbi:MAG: TonB-dependent receptor [Desulfopila sp.]|jgi:tetratricopeptide (TPR) repeat protein|nr:TonB-dependent receptor [Desulfopila sp.]